MKVFIIFLFPLVLTAQPDPRDTYPYELKEVNEKIKNDSLNSSLRWERANLRIELMRQSRYRFDDPFSDLKETDTDCDYFKCAQIERDLEFVYYKWPNSLDEGNFYLQRMIYYDNTKQFDKALHDALCLKDSIHFSNYGGRLTYYKEHGTNALPGLYILNGNYDMALVVLDKIIIDEKITQQSKYYAGYSSASFVNKKLMLLYKMGQRDPHINYLKSLFLENFKYYFDKKENFENEDLDRFDLSVRKNIVYHNNRFLDDVKEQGFYYLTELVNRLKEFESPDFVKYQKLHEQLKNPEKKTEYDSPFNLKLDAGQLKELINQF